MLESQVAAMAKFEVSRERKDTALDPLHCCVKRMDVEFSDEQHRKYSGAHRDL